MRKLIGLLLALNLGLLLTGLALQSWGPEAQPPLVFNADKIRLLTLPESATRDQPAARQVVVADEASVDAAAEVAPTLQADLHCMTWSSLDAAGLRKAESYLAQAGVALTDYDVQLEKSLGWWVFLPPPDQQSDVQASLDEVHRLGITDFALVRGGALRNAVSLGAFGKLALARMHAETLTRKGLNGVQFGPRPDAGPARLIFVAKLNAASLAKLQAEWPKSGKPGLCSPP